GAARAVPHGRADERPGRPGKGVRLREDHLASARVVREAGADEHADVAIELHVESERDPPRGVQRDDVKRAPRGEPAELVLEVSSDETLAAAVPAARDVRGRGR